MQSCFKCDTFNVGEFGFQRACVDGVSMVMPFPVGNEFKNILEILRLIWAAGVEQAVNMFDQIEVSQFDDQITLTRVPPARTMPFIQQSFFLLGLETNLRRDQI